MTVENQLSQCTFIVKLWQMLADEANFDVLAWDESGESFHVRGSQNAIGRMLGRYFRHNNFSSFQRQLNYFGFQKIKMTDSTVMYHHRFFCLDRPDDVPNIKRKTNTGAREKKQLKGSAGKGKRRAPNSPAGSLSRLMAAQPQPKRIRSETCISPSAAHVHSNAHASILPYSLSDITNRTMSRRSRRLIDIEAGAGESTEEEGESGAETEEEGELSPILSEFEETKYSWDGKPLEKLYPQLFLDGLEMHDQTMLDFGVLGI
jgi:hypothetical protein